MTIDKCVEECMKKYLDDLDNTDNSLVFEDWLKSNCSDEKRREYEELTEDYFGNYSLEGVVRLYIKHVGEFSAKRKTLKAFFCKFDPITKKILPRRGKRGKFVIYYDGWIREIKPLEKSRPKEYLEFEDWIKSKISQDISDKFEQTIYQSFILPLVQGIEFYIEHLSSFEGKKPKKITTFFRRFNTDTKTFLPKGKRGKLHIFYGYWDYNIKNKNITFTDYLISKLPEEQRQRATYYLKGLYLVDQIKESADFNKIKSAL